MKKIDLKDLELRVSCLHPLHLWQDGGHPLASGNFYDGSTGEKTVYVNIKLCANGHGMKIDSINANLVRKGSPFIRIDHCKYCGNDDTIGVLDEKITSIEEMSGYSILWPNESKNGLYEVEVVKSDT